MPRFPRTLGLVAATWLALSTAGCDPKERDATSGAPAATATASTLPTPAPSAPATAATHEGGAIARTARGDALVVADEDHGVVRLLGLPLASGKPRIEVAVPGAPAQVLALVDRVLVTVRDPGLLLVMKLDASGLAEVARVAVAADAWGVAVTPDEKIAIITSAWTHTVTAVDLMSAKIVWTVNVAREPRGVAVTPDGAVAYVSHLVGPQLTRVDVASGTATRVELPAAPLRTPAGKALPASFGFALAIDGDRVFAARHAIGALGTEAWFGASTVDVLLRGDDAPLAPRHPGRAPFLRADKDARPEDLLLPGGPLGGFTQPRALLARRTTRSLLVASEGLDALVELDMLALDPTNAPMRTYPLAAAVDPYLGIATTCGAPQGVALSPDEATAYVLCRATYDVAVVKLDAHAGAPFEPAPPVTERFADDPLGEEGSKGRRLFYNATDPVTSGGLACNGCHPEGRDDGHVWHEAKINTAAGTNANFVGIAENLPEEERVKGFPRRTPMLAGRIGKGPFGWHAESPDLPSRLIGGFGLHRWGALPRHERANLDARASLLAEHLKRGLVPPPRDERPLTPDEQRGQAIFLSEEARCARCHVPETGYADGMAYPLPKLPVRPGHDDEPRLDFKTPSLAHLGERAPYFHDGSAASLEDLVTQNRDRMGRTAHLSERDRAALVAFLRTL